MSLRFHEIAEANHTIQNPFTEEKLQLLGEIAGLTKGTRILDLACGKGEMLTRWAKQYDIVGVGVDISSVFIEAAKERAQQLDVANQLTVIVDDAATFPQEHHQFDVVMCIGATWIGGGLSGTLDLMRVARKSKDGLLLVGEPFWIEEPTPEIRDALGAQPDEFATLAGTLDRFEKAKFDLVEMVLADTDSWDRYISKQWMTVNQYLSENPNDRDANALRLWIAEGRRSYLTYGRRYMGWGVFVLHETGAVITKPKLVENPDRPVGVEIANEMLWVRLNDGRVIGTPLEWYPWLQNAVPEQLEEIELTTHSIEWTMLGERLEISALLRGKR